MEIYTSCKDAIRSCLETKSFAAAHLYNDEKPMDIHIHDCYEIYYSISGGKQFLIDNRFYNFAPGDIFFINQYESHYLSQIDNVKHERIILSIYPEYLKSGLKLLLFLQEYPIRSPALPSAGGTAEVCLLHTQAV